MEWNDQFMDLLQRCIERYRGGDSHFAAYYSDADSRFLREIGYKPRELFDFVEDYVDEHTPSPTTALLIAGVRRDYLNVVQDGVHSTKEIARGAIPPFGDLLDGVPYLPRIIVKARAKLRGELDADLMYCCGGDRKFLGDRSIHPADFLRVVWSAGNDDQKILQYVKNSSASRTESDHC